MRPTRWPSPSPMRMQGDEPMYLAVFRSRERHDIDRAAYDADAADMIALANAQPGFLAFKSYVAEDGETVAISEWEDEAAARAWRAAERHRQVQLRGRRDYYASYTLFAGEPSRISIY